MRTDGSLGRIVSHIEVLVSAVKVELGAMACRASADVGCGSYEVDDWQERMIDVAVEAQGHGYDDWVECLDVVPATYCVLSILREAWEDGHHFALYSWARRNGPSSASKPVVPRI
ncbi:hypothetical protein H8Z72_23410 (plasmid) [Xanthomonas citri pv. citri]|uniref:hypothetical protein n=1 Tax=Xanthomonas citri TaxID=346 RepID=UPI001933024A|nr:hypothetical protein [Xanthomonas citri]QRD62737.1 hypothetical protein H8Z74_22775 [Xanthomonas citri pv. citri]QRD67064.1 hypothetical protein H8Z73_22860 [Xanthomonas citri pv. citri]QRD71683.1 hypothetical protein H8Z72_23410 [Xanthomonas citri pv. citri]